MGFYDNEKTAIQYMEMAEGYNGRELIEILRMHLPQGASVLELGMGPGVDLQILNDHFQATGSDNSRYFVDRYLESDPDADLLFLDAVTLETEASLQSIFGSVFNVLDIATYREMEDEDSLYVLASL